MGQKTLLDSRLSLTIAYSFKRYRLVTCALVPTDYYNYAITLTGLFFHGTLLQLHYGAAKIACCIVTTLLATGLCGIMLDPPVNIPKDNRFFFAILGISLAEIFVNWDTLTMHVKREDYRFCGLTFATSSLLLITIFELGLYCFIHYLFSAANSYTDAAAVFYGFCLALPFVDHVRSSMPVLGEPSITSRRRLYAFRVASFTVAAASILVVLMSLSQLSKSQTFLA